MNRRSAETPAGNSCPLKLRKKVHTCNDPHLENDVLPSSSSSISVDTLIPKLPTEVMNHVFKFMSLRDRLNASLVCKEWHEAGSYPLYSRHEKLVFRGFQDFEAVFVILLKTKRKILNLEFHNCELKSSTLLSIADKIYYLSFINCKLCSTLQTELFVKCVNLNEVYFKKTYADDEINSFVPYTCLNRRMVNSLEKEHVVNESLKTLRLNTIQTDLTSDNIRSLFKIFPKIKHLTFKLSDLSNYNPNFFSPYKFSFDVLIQEIVSLKHVLENLKIFALEPQLRSLVHHDFLRLKRISISMPIDIPETLIFDFFSRLKCLERISCSSVHGSSFPTRFFEHLIHQCPHLKHLKLKFRLSCHIDLSPEMFRTLVSSNLISLHIILANFRPTSDQLFTTSMNSLENKTLRMLRIPVIIDHRMQNLFIETFKCLRVLQLECFSGTVLESIGLHQRNLTTLKLRLRSRLPTDMSDRFINPTSEWRLHQAYNCLKHLTNLENLDLNFNGCAALFDCKYVPLSVKCLRMCGSGFDPKFDSQAHRHLILALKEKTELEAIYFATEDARVKDFSMWSEICSCLKKLRYLGLCRYTTIPLVPADPVVGTPESVCERCPSLRFLALTSLDYHILFGYDYEKEKLTKRNNLSKMFDFTITDKIADSKIKFFLIGSICD